MLWDANRGVAIRQLSQPGRNPVQLAAFSPDGHTIAIGELSGVPYDVGLIDPETGSIRAELTGHASGIRAMAFSPDGRTLATAGDDGCIKLWNLGNGKPRRTITERVGRVKALAFSPNGSQLVFADIDQNLRVLDLNVNATIDDRNNDLLDLNGRGEGLPEIQSGRLDTVRTFSDRGRRLGGRVATGSRSGISWRPPVTQAKPPRGSTKELDSLQRS
jgi:WD40 repeat protein